MDANKWERVYDFFAQYAEENEGVVKGVSVDHEENRTLVSIEVPNLELRGDALKEFVELLGYINRFKITWISEDSIQVDAGVPGVWEDS